MIVSVKVITPPDRYPLDRDDAFNMLKLDSSNPALTDEAVFIEDLIAAATSKIEKFMGRALMTQTLKMVCVPEVKPTITAGVTTYFTENLPETVKLWRPPCQQLLSIKVVSQDLSTITVVPGNYNVNINAEPALIRLNLGSYWPFVIRGWYEIEYIAGYGDTIDKVPAQIRHALRLTVAQWYAQRENLDYTLPTAAVDLLDEYALDVGDL
jgi:hypothetical protein